MVVVEWHPHLVGDAAVDKTGQGVRREGFGRVDGAVGRLRPGGFAEVEVWTR